MTRYVAHTHTHTHTKRKWQVFWEVTCSKHSPFYSLTLPGRKAAFPHQRREVASHLRDLDDTWWRLGSVSRWSQERERREPGSLSPHQTAGPADPRARAGKLQRSAASGGLSRFRNAANKPHSESHRQRWQDVEAEGSLKQHFLQWDGWWMSFHPSSANTWAVQNRIPNWAFGVGPDSFTKRVGVEQSGNEAQQSTIFHHDHFKSYIVLL